VRIRVFRWCGWLVGYDALAKMQATSSAAHPQGGKAATQPVLTDMALLCCAMLCSPWVPAGHQIKLPGDCRDHLQQLQAHTAHTLSASRLQQQHG
jgi:hypothetical protein